MLTKGELQKIVDTAVSRIVDQIGQQGVGNSDTVTTLQAKVITTAQIPDGLTAGGKLIISRKAVITPAAKDELKQRGITFQRVPVANKEEVKFGGKRRLVIVGADLTVSPNPGPTVSETTKFDCVVQASQFIAGKTELGERCVVISAEAEVALIALNRHRVNRVIELRSHEGKPEFIRRCESTAANVVVVGATGLSHWQTRNLIEGFFEQEYSAIPAWL